MTITELVEKSHANAVDKGFYENPKETGTLLMLIVSELAECLEADRHKNHTNGSYAEEWNKWYDDNPKGYDKADMISCFESGIKDTVEDELADAIIRIADMAGYMGIDLEAHVIAKMRYNSTREYLHGKRY